MNTYLTFLVFLLSLSLTVYFFYAAFVQYRGRSGRTFYFSLMAFVCQILIALDQLYHCELSGFTRGLLFIQWASFLATLLLERELTSGEHKEKQQSVLKKLPLLAFFIGYGAGDKIFVGLHWAAWLSFLVWFFPVRREWRLPFRFAFYSALTQMTFALCLWLDWKIMSGISYLVGIFLVKDFFNFFLFKDFALIKFEATGKN